MKFKIIVKYFFNLFFVPIWYLQKIIPRSKKVLIFGGWSGLKYADNSKYLFEYIKSENKELRCIWLTRNKKILKKLNHLNIECYLINSFRGIWFSLISKNFIICSTKKDINSYFTNGGKIYQLWHGAPMKKIGLDDNFTKSNSILNIIKKFVFPFTYEYNYNFTLSTSEIFNDYLCSAFDLNQNQIMKFGYPRNDQYFKNKKHALVEKIDKNYNNPLKLIFLPTYRKYSINKIFFNEEFYTLNKFFKKNNVVLFTKTHFENNSSTKSYSNIINLDNFNILDLNEVLFEMDVLLTDFSGAYFDFLLTEKPIIFTPFDLTKYVNYERELYFKYDDIVAGPITKNWNEVKEQISKLGKSDMFKNSRKLMNHKFNSYNNGNSSKHICEFILKS